MRQLLFIFILVGDIFCSSILQKRVLHTSILSFLPVIKAHHIVLLQNTERASDGVYTLDFTPINQTQPLTLFKLASAQNVPSEIRLRHVKNVNIYESEKIFNYWEKSIQLNYTESQKESIRVFNTITDQVMREKISFIQKEWKPYMNLYKANCQHFSRYVLELFD